MQVCNTLCTMYSKNRHAQHKSNTTQNTNLNDFGLNLLFVHIHLVVQCQ